MPIYSDVAPAAITAFGPNKSAEKVNIGTIVSTGTRPIQSKSYQYSPQLIEVRSQQQQQQQQLHQQLNRSIEKQSQQNNTNIQLHSKNLVTATFNTTSGYSQSSLNENKNGVQIPQEYLDQSNRSSSSNSNRK
jgi:hypothetical protein